MTKDAPTAFTDLDPRLSLIFEDTHLLVLNKPTNLLSQGEHTGDTNIVDLLRVYLRRPYIGLVHRLDRNTSGLMVVAKRTKAAQRLTDALQRGTLARSYLGWVEGYLPGSFQWNHWIEKNSSTNRVKVVKPEAGKLAMLEVHPVRSTCWQGTPITLALFSLQTGRSHQIRVQASYEGYPLLGDSKYGAQSSFHRIALHSHLLEFPHPMTHETLQFKCPLPEDLDL